MNIHWNKFCQVMASCAISVGFYLLSVILSQFMVQSYHNLKAKEKVFWHMTIVRAVFGVYGAYVGVCGLFFEPELLQDVVYGKSWFSEMAVAGTVGFFIFECCLVTVSDLYYGGFQILLNMHHWLGLMNYALCLHYDKVHYFACVGLILEMSTPSSAICWTLLKCRLSHKLIWKINQFVLVHLFHLRSVVECYLWYITYKNYDSIFTQVPIPLLLLMYSGLVMVTFIMTPYWTYRKTQQLIIPFDFNFQPTDHSHSNGRAKKQ